ncbi:MAG TPA: hypothetical protein VEA63_13360, partial [Opitutus sp.]|nr:hypothetical protein [Opitutus sp.]
MISSSLVRFVLAGLAMALCLQSSVSASTWIPLTITRLTLVNSLTNQDIRQISAEDTIDLSKVGSRITVRADVAGKVGSVAFLLNGKTSSVENTAPYSMHGDADGDFKRWAPKPGTYQLRVIPYPSRNRGGKAGAATEITLRVIEGTVTPPAPQPEPKPEPEPEPEQPAPTSLSVTKLMLINAKTNKELRELAPGETVSLAQDGTELSVRAVVSGTAGSVQFYLNG